jgi:hypothetical protein
LSSVEEQAGKVLLLEKAKGFRDSAVLGGLDRYLKRLVENHSLDSGSPLLRSIAALPSHGCASLDPPAAVAGSSALRASRGAATFRCVGARGKRASPPQ